MSFFYVLRSTYYFPKRLLPDNGGKVPVLRGFSRRVKQDSEANEMSVGERHKVPNVAWESKTLLVLEKDIPLGQCHLVKLVTLKNRRTNEEQSM